MAAIGKGFLKAKRETFRRKKIKRLHDRCQENMYSYCFQQWTCWRRCVACRTFSNLTLTLVSPFLPSTIGIADLADTDTSPESPYH